MTIPLGSYLFKRIKSIGVDKIWGVPGDYNLQTLDYLYPEGLKWLGTCNELNAGYACDGYARISGVPGVFVTTYAVGELSALNAVSGASAENVPIIHIVGTSARFFQKTHAVIHHAPAPYGLKPNDHQIYAHLHDPFVCASEYIYDLKNAPSQIDRVIGETPIHVEWPIHSETEMISDLIVKAFAESKFPVIIVDLFALRFKLESKVQELLEKTGAMGFTTNLGKGAIDETHSQFYGVYNGAFSDSNISDIVESQSDFVLDIGPLNSDSNTGAFSRKINPASHIQIHSLYAQVYGKEHDGVHFAHILHRVIDKVPSRQPAQVTKPNIEVPVLEGDISQAQLPALVTKLLNKKDILIAETGTFQFSSKSVQLPAEAKYFTQIFYSCIGFALPAAVGAGVFQ